METMFADAVLAAKSAGASVLLVHEPSWSSVGSADTGTPQSKVDDAIETVARQHGVRALDPRAAFSARRDEFLFLDDSHLTPRGKLLLAGLIAEAIAEWFEARQPVAAP
ncbi:MAG: hypothetical protein KJ042_06965 [Deltaproteobacteria bacterium]|nr:hypothetical protein [Deltaproteobacteria bacterium]